MTVNRIARALPDDDARVAELDRLAALKEPFLLFLRHMDPHAPYLPPEPYERMFYHGNETDQPMFWLDGLDIPLLSDKPDAEVIYWVGCAASYDDRAKKVARAVSKRPRVTPSTGSPATAQAPTRSSTTSSV